MTPEYRPPLAPPQKQKSRALPWVVGGCAVLLLGAIVAGAGGYSFYRLRNAGTTNENTSGRSPSGKAGSRNQPEARPRPAESNIAKSQHTPVAQETRTPL